MIIGSLTTTPTRVGNLEKNIESIKNTKLVNLILLFYPRFNKRLNQAYPGLPKKITSEPILKVFEVEDQGPATKFIYIHETLKKLDLFSDKNQIVIFDDDTYYSSDSVSILYRNYSSLGHTNVMVGFQGVQFYYFPFRFSRSSGIYNNLEFNRVAVLEAACMIMCTATFFLPSTEWSNYIENYGLWIKTNDDLLLSSIAYIKKVRLYALSETFSCDSLSCVDSITDVNRICQKSKFGRMAMMHIYLIARFKLPMPKVEILLVLLGIIFVFLHFF